MVFSSLNFLFIFLPITLLLYYICKDITWKNVILLIASLVFYAWGEPVYIILMVISILFNYLIGKDIEQSSHPNTCIRNNNQYSDTRIFQVFGNACGYN